MTRPTRLTRLTRLTPLTRAEVASGAQARSVTLSIASHWDGVPLPAAQHAHVTFTRRVRRAVDGGPMHELDGELVIDVDAPYFGDAAPAGPPQSTPRLWEHEVVELFLADAGEHYLEVELGPHGHYLVLELSGVRRVVRAELPIAYQAEIVPADDMPPGQPLHRFVGQARVPLAYLPLGVCRANAYAIHGPAEARCHHACSPSQRPAPDFHALETFVPIDLLG